MTVVEFLDWEERQELRWEFDGSAPQAMTGGTEAHQLIQINLFAALHGRLRGKPCRAYGSEMKIQAAGSIRYPDAFVACGPINLRGSMREDPVVVFEILSSSTARTDRVDKMREYWDTPSIQRYVLIEQDAISATSFTRETGRWTGRVLWAGDMIDLPEIGIALPLDDLYESLDPAALRAPG